MKFRPVLTVFFALLIVSSLSSCVREYTCNCTVSYSGAPGLPDTTVNSYSVKDSKSKAKSLCEGNSYTAQQNGITITEDCKLY